MRSGEFSQHLRSSVTVSPGLRFLLSNRGAAWLRQPCLTFCFPWPPENNLESLWMMCLAAQRLLSLGKQQEKGEASVHEPWLLLRVTPVTSSCSCGRTVRDLPGMEGGKTPLVQGTYRTRWRKRWKKGRIEVLQTVTECDKWLEEKGSDFSPFSLCSQDLYWCQSQCLC